MPVFYIRSKSKTTSHRKKSRELQQINEHRGRMHYPRYRKAGMTIGSARIRSSCSSERLPAIRPHPAISLGGASHLHDLWPLKDVKPAISLGGASPQVDHPPGEIQ